MGTTGFRALHAEDMTHTTEQCITLGTGAQGVLATMVLCATGLAVHVLIRGAWVNP